MDRSTVIELVAETSTKDKYGVEQIARTTRTVFAQVDSVTRAEFFEGGRNGLNPEYRFTMFFADYNDEETVIYNGKAYGVYRVFHGRTDTVELYAERKGGTNGITENSNNG